MNRRYTYLDSSRGLAALSVVLSHFFGAYGVFKFLKPVEDTPVHIFWHGAGAVSYFFILSGFVLSISFFKDEKAAKDFKIAGYLIRRIFRIYPLYILSLCVSYILLQVYLNNAALIYVPQRSQWVIDLWRDNITIKEAFKQSLLLISIPESTTKLLPQGWTLKLEIIYSSLLPIAVLLIKKDFLLFLFFFIYLYYAGNWAFFAFALGILIAYYSDFLEKKIENTHPLMIFLYLLVGLILYTSPFNFLKFLTERNPPWIFKFQCIGASIFLICLLGNDFLKKILSKNFFTFLGTISYGIYLFHFFILIPFIPLFIKFINDHYVISHDVVKLFSLIILLIFTIIFGYLGNILIEKPFIKLGKMLENRLWSIKQLNWKPL